MTLAKDEALTALKAEHALLLGDVGREANADGVDPCGGYDAFRRGAAFALEWAIGQYPTAPSALIRQCMEDQSRLMAEGVRYLCQREAVGWPEGPRVVTPRRGDGHPKPSQAGQPGKSK